ncbi:MAG: WG repeat-containing protein, partial [Bacteroidetes bacterium]|nr:WG repeat-containing protein [Bacteroidota bacterium]
MNTKQLSLSIIFLCSTLSMIAQQDTIRQFYKYNYDIAIDKIEREHIPLDGNKVKMIPFRVDEYYGFVKNDEEQKWLIQPEYDQVFAVYEEGAIVKKDRGYGFGYGLINEKNEWLIYPDFHNLFKNGDLFHGLIEGVIDTSLPDYYDSYILNLYFDKQGNILFGENAHDLQTFKGKDTLAWFRLGRDYHIRSRSGKLVKSFRATENKRFIGISDNLLVFSEEEDSVYFCRAYNVNGEMIFTLPGSHKFINGLYKLSENLYGFVSYDGDVAYHYFSDSLGNDKPYKVITPTWPGLLHPDFNYFEEPFGATFLQPGFNYFDKET